MIYSFEDAETGEEYEIDMSYEDLLLFLRDNPKIHQTFRMNIVDPVGIGVTKPPADFQKHVLGRIKENHPHGKAIERRYSIPKEI